MDKKSSERCDVYNTLRHAEPGERGKYRCGNRAEFVVVHPNGHEDGALYTCAQHISKAVRAMTEKADHSWIRVFEIKRLDIEGN
jgi:hypothetical protein